MAIRATIFGLDTAAGAYLARLLGARGYAVRGTGDLDLAARLGIADDMGRDDTALPADEIYDLRGDAAAALALVAQPDSARLFIAVDPGDAALIDALAAFRARGRFVATGRVHANESRLGPGTSPVARIVAAAAAGAEPDPRDLATATDCGWTPEYVDAMWRMLQRPAPADLAIAAGVAITGNDAARVAAAYFKRPEPAVLPSGAAAVIDPRQAQAALGWRAVTTGDDLVTVLCEGVAS
jgi:GDP-D-mannose dehydratase